MHQTITPGLARRAADYLSQQDPVLGLIIKRTGLCNITPHHNYYWELIDSIISQQLSIKAAATIERRFKALFDSEFPEPAAILAKTIEELRTAGLSQAKANYIRDLARHIIDGELQFDKFDALNNEEIIAELTAVKGIGEWTAHMFLMFCMGRPDILPVGDLGIRNGIRLAYGLKDTPTLKQVQELAKKHSWQPYESIASWYIWQLLGNKPAI